jgi:hypothetical protein
MAPITQDRQTESGDRIGAAPATLEQVDRTSHKRATLRASVAVTLALWLALVVWLGAKGAFMLPSGTPPYPIGLGFGVPLVVFLAAFWISPLFRQFLAAADLPLLTAVQSWRFAGFGFLALAAYGVLPWSFAWPAGLGDMAIGLTAPWMALAIARRRGVAAGRLFVVWNLLGILDLVVAVAVGTLNQILGTGTPGSVSTTPMAQLPLLLIPAYLVPLFVMLHVTALYQGRKIPA